MNYIIFLFQNLFETTKKYQSTLIRWTVAGILIHDGFSQILYPLPILNQLQFIDDPQLKLVLILLTGTFTVILSTLLFIGISTRLSALALILVYGFHLYSTRVSFTSYQDLGGLILIFYTLFSQSETTVDQILTAKQKNIVPLPTNPLSQTPPISTSNENPNP